jgi:hypothetical protein
VSSYPTRWAIPSGVKPIGSVSMVNITFTLNANPYILSSSQNVRNLHYAVGCVLRTPVKNITIQNISYINDARYKRGLLSNPSIIQNNTQDCRPLVLTTARLLQTATTTSQVDITILNPSVDVQAMDVSSLIGVITTSNQLQAYAPAQQAQSAQSVPTLSVGSAVGITLGVIASTVLVTSMALFFIYKTNKTHVLTAVVNPSYREKNVFVPIRV